MKTLSILPKVQLGKQIFEASYIRGNFKLRSGQTSEEYFDKYKFEGDPVLLASIADIASKLIPKSTDVLAGLEMGGIPIATAISLVTGLPCAFVRKTAKDYGTAKVAEGADLKGKRILMVEDVITTGGQVLLSAEDLRKEGAILDTVLCVIDREQGGAENLAKKDLKLISLFTMSELKK